MLVVVVVVFLALIVVVLLAVIAFVVVITAFIVLALIAVERDHSLWFVLPHCISAKSPQSTFFLYVANAVARSVTLCGQFPHVADDNVMADVSQSPPQR